MIIFPITRDHQLVHEKWQSVLKLVDQSSVAHLIVIDKTKSYTATDYFMANFRSAGKNLIVLPRSISESHYETFGQIQLDNKLWVMQLHDDDDWIGKLELPNKVDENTIYFPKFFIKNRAGDAIEQTDSSVPAKINFCLVPSVLWNRFTLMIRDQKFHVAGSLDSTFDQMTNLSCNFMPSFEFTYYYDNHNWEGGRISNIRLTQLSRDDGWGSWSSVEIALFNRLIDNLTSLNYVLDISSPMELHQTYSHLMLQFMPSHKRRLFVTSLLLFMRIAYASLKVLGVSERVTERRENIWSIVERMSFVRKSWDVKNLNDVDRLVGELISSGRFPVLEFRFVYWRTKIKQLVAEGYV